MSPDVEEKVDAPLTLPAIRLFVLERMLWVWGLVGAPAVAVILVDDLVAGYYYAAAFYTLAYLLVIISLLPRFLPYLGRSALALSALYLVGSHEVYHHGLDSAGTLFYFGAVFFSCALLGARVALTVTAVALMSLCGLSYRYLAVSGNLVEYEGMGAFLRDYCLPDVMSLAILSVMAISFLSYLLQNLDHSVRQSQIYLKEIARERNQLIELIEARDQAEKQLQQAQKMEAVGQLAGGIAHDFNNLLQVVTAHTEIMLSNCEEGASERDQLLEVRKASERAAALTRQMLAYSRQQVMTPKYLDMNALLQELVGMLHRVIPKHIETRFTPGQKLGTVHADPVQLEQVFLNLCLNARDAMPDGGRLTITTEQVELNEEWGGHASGLTNGSYVRIRVADTGIGMDSVQQERLFEPFYTTKDTGEGTGLGLAMSYGIVKQHGGAILVESAQGKGAEFVTYLPCVDHVLSAPEIELPSTVPRGTETILVAEDDEAVRMLLIGVLKRAGFSVISAVDGEEALTLFREHESAIDLLLFDVVMPRKGGPEACTEIREINPQTRVLFMSGYAPEGLGGRFELGQNTGFIQKPYRMKELLSRIREVLDS